MSALLSFEYEPIVNTYTGALYGAWVSCGGERDHEFALEEFRSLELSDSAKLLCPIAPDRFLVYGQDDVQIGIDQYGSHDMSLKTLAELAPAYVRLDPFFLEQIENSSQKKLFLVHLLDLANILGIKLIAPSVDRISLYYILKNMDISLIHGPLIQSATTKKKKIETRYRR